MSPLFFDRQDAAKLAVSNIKFNLLRLVNLAIKRWIESTVIKAIDSLVPTVAGADHFVMQSEWRSSITDWGSFEL